jgi:hypothetical protein
VTDDEIKKFLRPQPNWLAVGGFAVALLTGAAALGRWVWTAPTQEDYRGLDSRTKSVELDHAVLKATFEGVRVDVSELKSLAKDTNAQIQQLRTERRR